MTSRERFLSALACRPLERPPVWIMRQAGRYLPEYRALKEKHSFVQMVRTPPLAAEVTLQPLRRFPLDAAILFSDILIIPEALGQPYFFRDGGGIGMDYALDSAARIRALATEGVADRLSYVPAALQLVRADLGEDTALLGFGGSPWTLATYMVEGGSSSDFSRAKALFFEEASLFGELMERLVDALVTLFRMKIEAGVDAVQIFDSWGAACPGALYEEMSLRWIQAVIERLPAGFPVIVYAKGMAQHHAALVGTGARALGVDWTVDLPTLRDALPQGVAVQGNLDPVLMELDSAVAVRETRALLERMHGRSGHIVNLGHGITPRAHVENVAAVVETVHTYRP